VIRLIQEVEEFFFVKDFHDSSKFASDMPKHGSDRRFTIEVSKRINEVRNSARSDKFKFTHIKNNLFGDLISLGFFEEVIEFLFERVLSFKVKGPLHFNDDCVTHTCNSCFHLFIPPPKYDYVVSEHG